MPAPPYAPLTGSVTVTSDSIDAGTINTCLIKGGSLTISGTLTDNGMLDLSPDGGTITVLSGGQWLNTTSAAFLGLAGSIGNAGLISNAGILDPTASSVDNTGTIANLAGAQFFASSAITSSGTINNGGDFRLVGGQGFAPTLNNSGAVTSTVNAKFSVILNSTLTNQGTFATLGTFQSTGTVVNAVGGQFTNTGTLNNGDPAGSVTATLTNEDTFTNTGASANFINGVGSTVTNNGEFRNEAGAGLTNSGNFFNDGGRLTNSDLGTSLTNQGLLQNSGAAIINNVAGAVLNNAGNIAVNSGTLNNSSTLNNLTLGTINNSGTLLNINGTLSNGNGATVNNLGALENSSPTSGQNSGLIDNHGLVSNGGTLINHAGGLINNQSDGVLQNQNNGKWTNEAGAELDNNGSWTNDAGSSISNAGTVRMTGTLSGDGIYQQTAGLTKMIDGGSIQQSQINLLGGKLLGAGTLTGSVTVSGGATIGAGDPNHLVINGPLSFTGGNLLVQVAGSGPGQYDTLGVTGGSVTFTGGSITFEFLPGFVLAPGETFASFLTADGGITGLGTVSFSFLGLAEPPGTQVLLNGNALDLVLGAAPVPEPGILVLLAMGLPMLLVARRPSRLH